MSDRSISQILSFGAVDFSRPALGIAFLLAVIGIVLVLLLYQPYSFNSAVQGRLLPVEVAEIGVSQLQASGVETEDQLTTTLPVKDNQLILFVRDRLGVRAGNEELRNEIPGIFWEVVLRSPNDHTTAFESTNEDAGPLQDRQEMHHALIKIDEQGRWFQYYHHPSDIEQTDRLSTSSALAIAKAWANSHPLLIPLTDLPFDPEQTASANHSMEGEIHRFQWSLPQINRLPGLTRNVTIEVIGDTVSYFGLEYEAPPDYPDQHRGLWQLALSLRIILLAVGIPLVIFLLIKQLRRDAIDFHFSFTYSALLTFPLIALIIAELPTLMNENFTTVVKENFYLLSSATFLWLILLLLATPIVALTDSLVRQVWSEKLSTFDALIRGRFRMTTIGHAIFIGLSFGLAATGLISLANALLVRFGGYSHASLLSTTLSGSMASFWAIIGSLGLSLVSGYLMLFIATLVRVRFSNEYLISLITGFIWLILISATGGRYSSVINFGFFALFSTAISIYLLLRYDLLALIIAQFGGFSCLAGVQLLVFNNTVYRINGLIIFIVIGAVLFYSKRIADDTEDLPEPEFVPQYITKLHSRERIERDIEIARQLQYQFLPQEIPQFPSLDIATLCRPAYEVGGDYYDFIELDDHRIGVVIADVSGKGIPAAFYMTMIKGVIQSRALEEISPGELLKNINSVIYKNTGANTFVTLFYAIIDTKQATIIYSNAGHNPPLLISQNDQIQELSCGGVVLGVMPQPDYEESELALKNGDLLLFYTDGVVETTDVLGREFGTQRLVATVSHREECLASQLITDIAKSLDTFAAGAPQADDITMILVSFKRDEKTDYRN